VLGTLDFMPPEQKVDATQTDARSDLWSVGATIYQMATGKSPRVIRLHELPGGLQDVLGKALEDEPADRYQAADDFRDALKNALDSPVAPKPQVVSEGELAKGQCIQCGVVNDLSRKFCEECAAALRVSCLSCEQTIPTWDKVCGECGGKQQELLEEQERSKAESMELLATIRERIGNKDLEGLLDQVTRALELRPDREDLQKIKGQLEEREKKATLTVANAEEFLADAHSVDLNRFTKIDDSAAESLGKHKGDLSLDGLTSLSDAAAESLTKYKRSVISLNGLTNLSDAAAESLGKYEGVDLWLNGLTSLSYEVAESLSSQDEGNVSILSLYGLTSLSDAAAEGLSKHSGDLFLGLTSLSDAAAESLGNANLFHLDLGLTSLSDAAAESLGNANLLDLALGLTSLSNAAAESLSKGNGNLYLQNLTSLSDAAAESLSKRNKSMIIIGSVWVTLDLNGLTSLSDTAAESLTKYEGSLVLELDNLPDSAAKILRQHPSFQNE